MHPYQIAFFDIDGTLVDIETKQISEKTKQALVQLQKQGVLLYLATGRPFQSIPHFDWIRFDGCLCFNGSYCVSGDQVIYQRSIAYEDVLRIVENAKAIHRPVSLASDKRISANGLDQDLSDYFALSKQRIAPSDDFEEALQETIYQIMMGAVPAQFDAILQGVESAEIVAWWDRAIDIIPAKSGKGNAVRAILAHHQIDASKAIAFGDGENDIEMLKAVGCGVAMGNANANVKAAADDVCKRVDEEGIYTYLTAHRIIDCSK